MTIPTRVDHVTKGLERLISQWDNSPNVRGLLTSFLQQVNQLEDVGFQLLEQRGIYDAIGQQLDNIGALFDVPRGSLTDEQYRTEILKKISRVESDGTTEVFLNGLRGLASTDFVDMFEHNSGEVHSWLGSGARVNTWLEVEDIHPAGVKSRIYVDDEFDSFRGTEELLDVFTLQTHVPDDIEVDTDGLGGTALLDVQKAASTQTQDNTFSILPEIEEIAQGIETPYLAEVLWAEVFLISGNIDDNNDDIIIDNTGDQLTWIDYTY